MRFTIATILCMTSLVLASPAPLCAAQVADDGLEVLDGKCSYPPRLGKPGPEDRRLECDTVVLLPSGQDSVLVQFAKKGSGAPVGFAGPIGDNGEMSVRRVYLSPETLRRQQPVIAAFSSKMARRREFGALPRLAVFELSRIFGSRRRSPRN